MLLAITKNNKWIKTLLYIFILFVVLFIRQIAYASSEEEEIYYLDQQEMLKIALENNKKLIYSKKGLIEAEAEIKKAYSELYPHLSIKGGSSYTKWLKKKTYSAELKVGDEVIQQALEEPTYPPYSNNIFVSASQQIFSGGRLLNRIKVAQKYLEKSLFEYNLNQQTVSEKVLESYYTLCKFRETKKVYQEDILRGEFLVNIMEAKLKEGQIPEVDLQRVKLNLRESQLNLMKIENKIAIALNELKRLLGLNISSQLKLKEEELRFNPLEVNPTSAIENALNSRLEIKQSEIDSNIEEFSLKIAKSEYYPQISLSGDYNWQSNEKTFGKAIEKLKEYQWVFSLNIEIPLFDGGYRKAQIKSAEAKLDKAKITDEIVRENILFEGQEVLTNLREIEEIIKLAQENRSMAEENLKIIEIKYNEGKIPLSELFNAKGDLIKASLSYVELICDYELTKVKFYKAVGKLDEALKE